eukprot:Nk52_evm44s252 gene=Nk52_evmTU44s252
MSAAVVAESSSSTSASFLVASSANLKEVLLAKEKELRDLNDYRIKCLENACSTKDEEIFNLKIKLRQLAEDFNYNLTLLEQRDHELEKYDGIVAEIKGVIQEKDADISQLKISCDRFQTSCVEHERSRVEFDEKVGKRFKAHLEEFNLKLWRKEEELMKQRSLYEEFKRSSDRKLVDAREDLEIQRRQLNSEFEEHLSSIAHDHTLKCDELHSEIIKLKSKYKSLESDYKQAMEGQQQAVKELEALKTDVKKNSDDKKKSLETEIELANVQEEKMRQEELVRELQKTVDIQRENHKKAIESYESLLKNMRDEIVTSHSKTKNERWSFEDEIKNKETALSELRLKCNEAELANDRLRDEMRKGIAQRDTEIQSLGRRVEDTREENTRLKSTVVNLKKEVDAMLLRRAIMDEDPKKDVISDAVSESSFIDFGDFKVQKLDLSSSDNSVEVNSKVKSHAKDLASEAVVERETELRKLREENNKLKDLVRSMRKMMEDSAQSVNAEFSTRLEDKEKTVQELNSNVNKLCKYCDYLTKKLEDRPSSEKTMNEAGAEISFLQGHINDLNNIMISLKEENRIISERLRHEIKKTGELEGDVESLEHKCKEFKELSGALEKQLEDDLINEAETSKSQICEVEALQASLRAANTKAAQYREDILNAQNEIAQLSVIIKELKIKNVQLQNSQLSAKEKPLDRNDTEKASLKNRIRELELQIASNNGIHVKNIGASQTASLNSVIECKMLKNKLVEACRTIRSLLRDRQRLTDLSNSLRAKLMKYDIKKIDNQDPQQYPVKNDDSDKDRKDDDISRILDISKKDVLSKESSRHERPQVAIPKAPKTAGSSGQKKGKKVRNYNIKDDNID